MGKLRDYSFEEITDIIDCYVNKQLSIDKIAAKYGAGRGSITQILNENNIHIRTARDRLGKDLPSREIQDKVIYNYTILGKGLIPSGRDYGLTQYMVKKILEANGVYIRSYTESKDNLRKYSCDDDYFKTQSHNMAYILGFLAADGNVAKKENQINIVLDSNDAEVLEKIREEMKITRPLKIYKRGDRGTSVAKLETFSATMKKDLAHYSIVPAKTFTLMPPELLKPEYYISYIRGYFDGDGSVFASDNWIGASIGSASKPIIEWIRRVLAEKYNICCNKIESNKELKDEKLFYRITYYNTKVFDLYKVLYIKDSIYMARKKNKFEEILMNKYPRDYESLVKD